MVSQPELQEAIAKARKSGMAAANAKKRKAKTRKKPTTYHSVSQWMGAITAIDCVYNFADMPDFPGRVALNNFANANRQMLGQSGLPANGIKGAGTALVVGGVGSKIAQKLAPRVRVKIWGKQGVRL